MPDRIVRTGILSSESVNALDWAAEVFYRRLMQVADDHGRYDGRPAVLRAALYPLALERVRDADIETWIRCACEAGLVRVYSCIQGKPHVEILKFGQRIQSKSKWPDAASTATSPGTTVTYGESPPIRGRYSGSDSMTKSVNPPLPPKLPQSVAEAIAWGAGAGVPEMFLKTVFLEHEGTAWTFAGKPVSNWKSYVTSRWMTVKDRQEQREKYLSTPKKQFPRSSPVSKPTIVPDWMGDAEEIHRLLVSPGENKARIIELGKLLPKAGWSFLAGDDYNCLNKIMKEAA